MERFVLINYKEPNSPSTLILESKFVGEDDSYLYLESGRYRKKYVTAMQSRIIDNDGEDEEDGV